MGKVESRQQGPPAKKAKLVEVLAAHYRADLVAECMKKKGKTLYYQVTFVFVFRPKMNVHFRFRFVFGRKWNFIFVGIFFYGRK